MHQVLHLYAKGLKLMDIKKKAEVFSFFLGNRNILRKAIEDYRKNPVLIRNLFAESGREVTPQQLKDFCNELENLLDYLDEKFNL